MERFSIIPLDNSESSGNAALSEFLCFQPEVSSILFPQKGEQFPVDQNSRVFFLLGAMIFWI